MAGLHQLKIIVVDGGKADGRVLGSSYNGGTGATKTESQKRTKGGTLYKVLNWNDTVRQAVVGDTPKTTQMAIASTVSVAKQATRSYVNYYLSDIGRKNGDSNYQAIVQRRMEQVSDITGFATSALSGAASGAIAGPIGAAIGAVTGMASHGIQLAFKYAERERAYSHEMFQQNNSQAYNLARANFSALTGRVR